MSYIQLVKSNSQNLKKIDFIKFVNKLDMLGHIIHMF